MKAFLAAGLAVAALSCLAGCDRSAAASTSKAVATANLPADMPVAPAGRWAYVQQIDDGPAVRDERCRLSEDSLTEIMMIATPPERGCSRSISERGGAWIMHMACGGGEKSITVDTTVSGDFSNGYVVEASRVSAAGIDDFTSQKVKLNAERLGDC